MTIFAIEIMIAIYLFYEAEKRNLKTAYWAFGGLLFGVMALIFFFFFTGRSIYSYILLILLLLGMRFPTHVV